MSRSAAVEALFFAALEKSTGVERTAFLDSACAGNADLRRQVEKLLQAHADAGDFLEKPIVERLDAAPRPSDVTQDLDDRTVHKPALASTEGDAESGEEDPLLFLKPSARPDSLGRIGHYEVLEILGKGGFGIVLRAFDEKLQRVVAIKVMNAQLAATSPARKRFLREARSSAKVRHVNVVQVYAVEEQPLPYLVMEYIPGETLQQRIQRTGPLETAEVLELGRQIAEGLAAAHAQGLVHRDIKPGNILIETGPNPHVKITDFGLARAADDASLTQSGTIAGTPMFMSPEQAHGCALDHRTDLFSLGSVLYTMASGRPPFRAESTLAVLKRVAEDTPRPIREIIPEVPQWLCDVIARLHAKKPEDRIGTAQEVADLFGRGLQALDQAADFPPLPVAAPIVASQPSRQDKAPVVAAERKNSAAALPRPRLHARRWAAIAVLVAILGSLGFTEATGVTQMRGTVIRLFSPEGTLVVEVEDPGVSVQIDGSDLVITGAGAKEIRLKPGDYTVEARKAGKVVSRELVTVTNAGKQVVRISQEPALDANSAKAYSEAAAWERSVAGMAPAEQAKAVGARLKELNSGSRVAQINPGFDGKLEPTITDNAVTGLRLCTDNVTDISPVHALGHLKSLTLKPSPFHEGRLMDLSPLRGLPLAHLDIGNNAVSDLSPLRGMKLTSFNCGLTHVRDLSPLKEMPLESLTASFTKVVDLSPLSGMKLSDLSIEMTEVSDLTPLRGMPLWRLWCCGLKKVTDLSPLKGTALTDLNCEATGVTDLAPLKGVPNLQSLNLNTTGVSDAALVNLTGLKKLTDLRLERTNVTAKGIAELAKTLPGCRVQRNAGMIVPPGTSDPDRCAAEYVLSLGGSVRVRGAEREIKAAADLPKGSIELIAVVLITNKQVTDEGLAVFKDCKNVIHLDLAFTPVTDAGLAHFKNCNDLKFVYFVGTQLTDAGLAELRGCKNLIALQSNTNITDAGLAHLKDCEDLALINVNNCRGITDGAMAHLAGRTGLTDFLGLAGTRITDAGLAQLKTCPNLQRLDLRQTEVTDAGLARLGKSESLIELRLEQSKVTEKGVEGLSKALPKCKIVWDGGVVGPR